MTAAPVAARQALPALLQAVEDYLDAMREAAIVIEAMGAKPLPDLSGRMTQLNNIVAGLCERDRILQEIERGVEPTGPEGAAKEDAP